MRYANFKRRGRGFSALTCPEPVCGKNLAASLCGSAPPGQFVTLGTNRYFSFFFFFPTLSLSVCMCFPLLFPSLIFNLIICVKIWRRGNSQWRERQGTELYLLIKALQDSPFSSLTLHSRSCTLSTEIFNNLWILTVMAKPLKF